MKFTKDVPTERGFYWAIWAKGEFHGGNGEPLIWAHHWEGPEVVEFYPDPLNSVVLFLGQLEDTPHVEDVRFGDRVEKPTVETDEHLPPDVEAFGGKK